MPWWVCFSQTHLFTSQDVNWWTSRVGTCELLWGFYQLLFTAVSRWSYKQSLHLPDIVDLLCISLSLCVLHSGGQSELSASCTIGDALLLLSPSLSDLWCHSDFSSQTVIFPASVIHLMSFRTECLCGSPATIFVKIQKCFCPSWQL